MRTEKEILEEFEDLGYSIIENEYRIKLRNNNTNATIEIDYENKIYWKENSHSFSVWFTMQEHKLLTDLFKIWGWL